MDDDTLTIPLGYLTPVQARVHERLRGGAFLQVMETPEPCPTRFRVMLHSTGPHGEEWCEQIRNSHTFYRLLRLGLLSRDPDYCPDPGEPGICGIYDAARPVDASPSP